MVCLTLHTDWKPVQRVPIKALGKSTQLYQGYAAEVTNLTLSQGTVTLVRDRKDGVTQNARGTEAVRFNSVWKHWVGKKNYGHEQNGVVKSINRRGDVIRQPCLDTKATTETLFHRTNWFRSRTRPLGTDVMLVVLSMSRKIFRAVFFWSGCFRQARGHDPRSNCLCLEEQHSLERSGEDERS